MAAVDHERGRARKRVARKTSGTHPRQASAQVRAYFAAAPPIARRALRQLRAAIRSAAPGAVEAFSYRIPAFRLDDRPLGWYSAFKPHCSLFPITGNIRRAHVAALTGYQTS